MNPKITIGITAYNASTTISRAAQSALEQNYSNTEIIIVDDCSLDNTWEIIRQLATQYAEKIRIYQNEKNLGVAGTRNRIIKEAHGEFLVFFDDDDVSPPDRIQKQLIRITDYERDFSDGAPVICHTARLQRYPDGTEVIASTIGCDETEKSAFGRDVAARILYNKKIVGGDGSMPTCSQMARLTTYVSLGGFDDDFRRMEDTELNIRLALMGGHFIGIAEPLVIQNMTLADDKNIKAERDYARKMYKKYAPFLIEEGRGDFDIKWLELKHDYWESNYMHLISSFLSILLLHPIFSLQRIINALPNMGYNTAIRRFHAKDSN